jgi:hypothetical protein
MNTKAQKSWLRLCTGALAVGGVAFSTLGLAAGTAHAAPPPAPMYHHHWCPGDQWDQGWGPYQNWNSCRDWDDGYNGGSAGYGPPGYGPGSYGPGGYGPGYGPGNGPGYGPPPPGWGR